MAEYITIKTKDEWGRESKVEFCVDDITTVALMIAKKLEEIKVRASKLQAQGNTDEITEWAKEIVAKSGNKIPNDSAANTTG